MRYSILVLAQAISSLAQTSTCTTELSTDRPGGDYAALSVSSFDACATACSSDPRCLTAQFRKDNSFCYLKNFITGAVTDNNVDSVVCRTCANGEFVPNTSCRQECNTDRPGSDIRAVGPINDPNPFARCAQLCNAEPSCVTAQYLKDNKFCYLKERANQAVSNARVDGIVCRSSSSTTSTTTSSAPTTTTTKTTTTTTPTTMTTTTSAATTTTTSKTTTTTAAAPTY